MSSEVIEIPNFEFSGFYYPDLLRALIIYNRINSPEITDEDDHEPFTQLLRSFALVGHLNNVNIDIVGNEALFGSARLLESVRQHLGLIGVKLDQNRPATVDEVLEFSKVFTTATNIVPSGTQFATEESEDVSQILYEASVDNTIDPTNIPSFIYQHDSMVFGLNRSGEASTDAVLFNLFDSTPATLNDMFYIGHKHIMWDTLDITVTTPATNLVGVWEFYDGVFEDATPDLVTNLGSNLRFNLTAFLGTTDRTGSSIKVILSSTGATETILSTFSGGINIIETAGLLGQSIVSVEKDDYTIGSDWNPLSNVVDGTVGFTQNGVITFTLPQSESQNWISTVINSQSAFWIRFRVISHTGTMPILDRVRIDTGKQFLLVNIIQGETVTDDPLGSGTGEQNQEFTLSQTPMIENTLKIELDEGTGYTEWSQVENFLTSTTISKDFILEVKGDDTVTVKFGDGIQGKIPINAVDNIRAEYRIGADVIGNVGANTINVNKAGISFVDRVFNPRQGKGHTFKEGSTRADINRLKIDGPANLRVRNRGITPSDFEFLARTFENSSGSKIVDRAVVIEETFGIKTIELVVVGSAGALLTDVERTDIENFFNGDKTLGIDGVGLSNHEVTVINYVRKVIDVTVTVTGGNLTQITNSIGALISPISKFDDGATFRWDFAQEVPLSIINAEIIAIDPINIKKVVITVPATNVVLDTRELPFAGVINVTVI